MASTRLVIGIIIVGSALAVATACSSSTTGTSSGGTSGTGTSGGSTNGVKQCPSTGTSTSNCKSGELETYSTCVQDKCDGEYKKCLGPDYKTGTFAGACGSYVTCTNACACEDNTCRMKCTLSAECSSCFSGFGTCSQACTVPACASQGSSGTSGASGTAGGKTCAELETCCNAKTGASKDACVQAYDAVKGSGDSACNAAYGGYCSGS